MVHTKRLNVQLFEDLDLQIPCPSGSDWLRIDITFLNLTTTAQLLTAWYVPVNKYIYANRLLYKYRLPVNSKLQLSNLLIGPDDYFVAYPSSFLEAPGIAASCIITYITPD